MREPAERDRSQYGSRQDADAARRREAELILKRVHQETEPQIGAASRILTGTRRHFAAGDADPDDAIDVLGTRIGRFLALFVFLALAVSLAAFVLRG